MEDKLNHPYQEVLEDLIENIENLLKSKDPESYIQVITEIQCYLDTPKYVPSIITLSILGGLFDAEVDMGNDSELLSEDGKQCLNEVLKHFYMV